MSIKKPAPDQQTALRMFHGEPLDMETSLVVLKGELELQSLAQVVELAPYPDDAAFLEGHPFIPRRWLNPTVHRNAWPAKNPGGVPMTWVTHQCKAL